MECGLQLGDWGEGKVWKSRDLGWMLSRREVDAMSSHCEQSHPQRTRAGLQTFLSAGIVGPE